LREGDAMPHYGILHDYKFEDGQDVRGAEVYGVNDEKLGKVDDVIFDHATGEIRYVVVDTGGWLSSKKFLVPVNRIQPYGSREDQFYADLDKERIRMLPEFDQEALTSEAGWAAYEKQYEEQWNNGIVMYNKETGKIVTPPDDEIQAERTTPLSEAARRSLMRDFTPTRLAKGETSPGAPSSSEITLQPQKPSIGGSEDVLMEEESVPPKQPASPEPNLPNQPLEEPGVYVLDRVPEGEEAPDAKEPPDAHYGRRWIDFQQKLRAGRDKVVSGCPLCGTHDKAA
jgi:sporulation protein YlmC with PRC-barrel domain